MSLFPCVFGDWLTLTPQTREEEPNHRHLNQRFARLHFSFVILAHSSVTREPAQGAFNDPTTLPPNAVFSFGVDVVMVIMLSF